MTHFLASDIVFPSDSNEPKLSLYSTAKLPDPVDWAFHDYYSTALEKAHMPLYSLVDMPKLEPNSQHLRAVLRGALEMVTSDMERNRDYSTTLSHHAAEESWKWEDDLLDESYDPSEPDYSDHCCELPEDDDSAFGENESVLDTYTLSFPFPSTTTEDDNDIPPSYDEDIYSTASESQQSNSSKWSGVVTKIKSWMKPTKKPSFQKFLLRR